MCRPIRSRAQKSRLEKNLREKKVVAESRQFVVDVNFRDTSFKLSAHNYYHSSFTHHTFAFHFSDLEDLASYSFTCCAVKHNSVAVEEAI